MTPEARREGLLVQELGGEVVVYDQEQHKAHRLDSVAATVWQNCDGRRDIGDLARVTSAKLNARADESSVELALGQLAQADLLTGYKSRPSEEVNGSRRRLLKVAASAGAIIPVVATIVSPTAARVITHAVD